MAEEKKRYIYIDLLRGWAVLVMIEVHVVNAFILPEFSTQPWFSVLNFVNGLVAPSFLFASGYSFVLVAQRKWNEYLNITPVAWKQLGRIAQILAVGYLLHLPLFSFTALTRLSWSDWEVFWKVDVLHAIAVSLLAMLALIIILRKKKPFIAALGTLAVVMVFAAPLMVDRNLDHLLPSPIANYFTAAHQSQFPLFPWMGFVLCGGIASQLMVWMRESAGEKNVFIGFSLFGLLAIAVPLIIDPMQFTVYPAHNYWTSNPGYFFIRLGIVIVILSGLWYWEQTRRSGKSMVSIVGSESLIAYAGHLMVIYGQFIDNNSAAVLIGKTQGIPEVLGMTAFLMGATVSVSYVWHRIKNWSMFYARVLMYSVLIVVLYFFFTNTL
jgi:uncharacterized membrane protein